jgi:MraZ protein
MVNGLDIRFVRQREFQNLLEQFFSGSALCRVDTVGRLSLPRFVLATLARRGDDRALLIGAHEADPCLVAYDRAFVPLLHADLERRRIADEPKGVGAAAHHARSRRAFGFVAAADVDAGTVILPPMMRRRARIAERVLVIGCGAAFEIWDADSALESGDSDLAEIARFHLEFQNAA